MTRRRISTTERASIFKRNRGLCHLCGGRIAVAELWDVSHDIPLELGGADQGDNLKVAHRVCHRTHTAAVDIPTIAKAKRREAAHIGAKAEAVKPIVSAPFPIGKGRKEHPVRLPVRRPMFVDRRA